KSRDGGSSWQRLVTGLDNTGTLGSVSISPQTNKTLFLSTLGDGIYKSQDQGVSWSNVNNGLDTLKINLLSISPHSNDVVLAAGEEKSLYKTKDGGKNWSKVIDSQNPITVIAFSPDNKDQIVVGDVQGNLIISNNEGENWQPASTLKNNGAITTIALSPNFSSDQTVFVGTENGGIFKSADKGSSFQEINKDLADKRISNIVIVE
ncbi:MAG TPA: glycosyl hydrolase, partial [Cyanobacteria bacterium UBA11148]|nr:glycosyl hydrolase [Cyanobacteria bacterium UBA11148]